MLERKKIVDILIGAMTVAMVVTGLLYYAYKNAPRVFPKEQTVIIPQEPQKIDFGTNVPTDFPTDIPLEKGVTVAQSYSLNYVGQKQLTIVFLSSKTVKENYSLYSDFLKKQNWNIVNNYESTTLSSLYETKASNDINVTISKNISTASTNSLVSISVLKK
jgi:hypothetical protein